MVWDVSREIVGFGSFTLRWYSLFFALGGVFGFAILQHLFSREGVSGELLDGLIFYLVIGTIVGARLGHCLLYEPEVYLRHPLRIFAVWQGGLASHGGFTGVILAVWLFVRRHPPLSFFWLVDRVSVAAMAAAASIRIGNFFNSEIYGKPTDVSWAVVFKRVDMLPRHPTQLYEAAGYAVIVLLMYGAYRLTRQDPREGRLFGLALVLGYSFRFGIEQFKENQVLFESALPLNMGQLLSVPFILLGVFFLAGGQYRFRWLRAGLSEAALQAAGLSGAAAERAPVQAGAALAANGHGTPKNV